MKIPYFMPISISLLVGLLIMLAGVSYWQFTYQPSTNRVASETLLPTPTSSVEEVKTFQNNPSSQESTETDQNLPQTSQMTSSPEILNAVNNYRSALGLSSLSSDSLLCSIAQSRANEIVGIGSDGHANFENHANAQSTFTHLGEVIAYGNYPTSATSIVEWGWDSSPTHKAVITDPIYQYGCAGIAGYSVVFLTGTK